MAWNRPSDVHRGLADPTIRITVDDEENATYTPDEPTASIFAYASTDALAQVTAKQICPTIRQGKFRFAHLTWS